MKPIMLLDVDDTLLVWTNRYPGFAAPRAAEFVHWAAEHFEVRWMTMWCPSGQLREDGAKELSYRFNFKVSPETFMSFNHVSKYGTSGHMNSKTSWIDWDELKDRDWVWVEDALIGYEMQEMIRRNFSNNFYKTNVTTNRIQLQATWKKLAEKYNLPGPKMPYHKLMDCPLEILSHEEIIAKFRSGKLQNHDATKLPSPAWFA